ncbi:MAG: PHP domain-containing protein [Chitinispirillales bacterium]|jgi:histidinol phosphatase-like PHP family hydrolase|nr:PHP domain-containing protein [Chitinispirillales bacterium]
MIRADLHIHSCLSPCGDLEMGPYDIVERAIKQNLTHIALTDHNTARNCEAFATIAKKSGLGFIPGIEVTTAEEAHIVCLFNSLKNVFVFGSLIEDSLWKVPLNAEKMGEQIVINCDEEIIGEVDFYLSVASSYSVNDIVQMAIRYDGIAFPAHTDKPVFSILTQLGFLPDLPFSAVEISSGFVRKNYNNYYNYNRINPNMQIITSSDSHFLHTVGTSGIEIDTESNDLFGILKELKNQKNDKIKCFAKEICE